MFHCCLLWSENFISMLCVSLWKNDSTNTIGLQIWVFLNRSMFDGSIALSMFCNIPTIFSASGASLKNIIKSIRWIYYELIYHNKTRHNTTILTLYGAYCTCCWHYWCWPGNTPQAGCVCLFVSQSLWCDMQHDPSDMMPDPTCFYGENQLC